MQYFTPALFEELNSPDLNTAFAATEKWNEASRRYQELLREWIPFAPTDLRDLAAKFCGHDAKFMQSWSGGASYCMVVATESNLWTLSYQILSEPTHRPGTSRLPCWSDAQNRLWLYDEVSKIGEGRYRHEILASDGSTFQIDFSDVQLKSALVKKDSPNQKFDLKIEISLTSRDLIAAFKKLTLRAHKPSSSSRRSAKPVKKSKSHKLASKPSNRKKANSI